MLKGGSANLKASEGQKRNTQMAEPKTAIEPLSLRKVPFEHFEEFFETIIEQSEFTPDQQLALGEQLKAGVEKRDKPGICLPSLTRSTTLCWLAAEICR
jgi:hypothetical protein